MEILEIIGLLAVLFLSCYYYLTNTYDFWSSRGIPGPKPKLLFGNFKEILFGKTSLGNFIKQVYDKYKDEPMFGIYALKSPVLILNDPDLIKEVLVKSFSSFGNRGIRIFEKVEPLSPNLVNLEVGRWKPLRAKQTTMFTGVKLKEMFYLLLECANHMEKILDKMVENNDIVECCELTSRFTTDVIGACVFGIDMKALEDEKVNFVLLAESSFMLINGELFKMRFKQIFPSLYTLLRPIMYDHEINDFFIGTMIETMKYRKKNNIRRGDFVDLLIDLKDSSDKLDGIELTDTLLTAQAFAFFFAGFDTSSLTMSHALYELALNQNIQDKLRAEINGELMNNDGKLEFARVGNLQYLTKVVNETLRKYPVTTILTRESTEPYTFSNTLKVPKGTRVWIPVFGIHRDPKIYPDPEIFDPERFEDDKVKERHQSYYLPFGAGPRNCLGMRFGTYQTKVGLIKILKSYKVDVCDKTTIPYVSNARRFLLGPIAGINLRFTKLD